MQTSFSEYEYASKKRLTRRDRFLAEIETMTPWSELVAAIAGHYLSYSNRHADLLFELISRRYEKRSTIVTTNKKCAAAHFLFSADSILMLS